MHALKRCVGVWWKDWGDGMATAVCVDLDRLARASALMLPPPEDLDELAMDARQVRVDLAISPRLYRRLQAERDRRRRYRLPHSLRAIIVELIECHLPEESE